MNNNAQDRAQYLSLGVFAQAVIDALIGFIKDNKREDLHRILPKAIEALRQATSSEAGSGASGLHDFQMYEHVRTFEEVGTPARREKVLGTLEQLSKLSNERRSTDCELAKEAIAFFYELENRALRNFDQPFEPAPRGMRELCGAR